MPCYECFERSPKYFDGPQKDVHYGTGYTLYTYFNATTATILNMSYESTAHYGQVYDSQKRESSD